MQIRCLGPLGASEAGRDLALGGPKQRLLLAHLLVRANQAVPVDRLIAEIWGENPPAAVRSSLHGYVSHLRKALGTERIEGRGQGYTLRVEPDEVDRMRFEALATQARHVRATDPAKATAVLREALGLWQGSPFADLADAPSLQPEIARLEELRLATIEDRVGADLDLGRDRELIAELDALTANHPLRERLWGQLMIALYRSGRQGDALAAFERARAVLTNELGIDPSQELRSVHERVLRQDPSLLAGVPALKGYRLLERLGDGAFGVVWLATQPGVDREVVVKAARPAVANRPQFIRRFAADAQRVARIEHPHVVPLYDFWREPDGAYLVLRFLRGGSLGGVINGPAAPDRATALRIADQVAQALAAAHRQGVVHGNLKPSNVLLDQEGNAFLADFAIALDDERPQRTDLPYLAPERIDGAPPDPRTDVYAFGVLLSQLLPGADDAIADVLRRATARGADQRQQDAAELLANLRAATRTATPPDTAAAAVHGPRNPYKGLRAFTEGDAADYFGRETAVARLLTRLRDDGRAGRFLAVVGPSGSGKSSLVRAGLVPAVRAGALPASNAWYVAQMVPGEEPFDALATALRHVAVDAPDALAGDVAGLNGVVSHALPEGGELLLVIDQFEELFTLVADDRQRQRFIDVLVTAVTAPDSRVRIVVTLRADLYDRPLQYRGLADLLRARTEVVVPLTPHELERAVTGPAERVGVDVERALVAQMIADVSDQAGALPLLQYALTEVFDNRRDATLSASIYQQIGGVAGALGRRAEAVFATLPDDAQATARQLFLALVMPGKRVEDTRRRAAVADVTALAPDAMPGALTAFGDARLLSFDRDAETRAPTVEVAHEALLREWRRLRGWVDAARDDLRTQRRLQAAAADWDAADREPSFLATGSRLDRYAAWRATSDIVPTRLEQEYLDASVAHHERLQADEAARRERELELERRSVHRLRTLVAVLAVAALAAGGLTIYAVTQARRAADLTLLAERETRLAAARELAAAADANLSVDPERSMLLAIAAIDQTRSVDGSVLREAEEALHRAVGASRVELRVPDVGGAVAWSPDGAIFVTEGPEESGMIDIRDATTGASLRSWRGHDVDVNDVAFSPDGTRLATTGDDAALRIWDPSTGELVSESEGDEPTSVWGPSFSPDGEIVAATWLEHDVVRTVEVATGRTAREIRVVAPFLTCFSPDGQRLVVSGAPAGSATVVDIRSGDTVMTLDGHESFVRDVAWSPDGRQIATTTFDVPDVRIFDAATGDLRFRLFGHATEVRHAAWSADGSRLATTSGDGTVRIWNVFDGGAEEALVLASQDLSDGAVGVAFSPDGTKVMAGDQNVEVVLVWNVEDSGGGEWATMPVRSDAWTPLASGPDGDHVLTAGPRHAVVMWDPRTGVVAREFGGDLPAARIVAAGGRTVAAGFDDGTVAAWDADTGRQRFAARDDRDLSAIDVSADGNLVAVSRFGEPVRVLDDEGGTHQVVDVSADFDAAALAFSPDRSLLAVAEAPHQQGAPGQVLVWDLGRETVTQTLRGHAIDIEFDATGRRLASAQIDRAEVWDVGSGRVLADLRGHRGPVSSAAFDAAGSRVATASFDGEVRLWDVDRGVNLLELPGHDARIGAVAFAADGALLASAGADGFARAWALDLDDLIGMARDRLTRDLTEPECRQYLHDACPAS